MIRAFGLLTAALIATAAYAFEVPVRDSWVVDRAGALATGTRARLNAELERIQAGGGPQIQVVIVPRLEGETVEGAALQIAEKYRLGHAGKDNGALLLVALQDRELRIEVGRGLEGDLPDVTASQIIRQVIVPEFKQGRIEEGIVAGVAAIAERAGASFSDTARAQLPRPRRKAVKLSPVLIFFIVILWMIISRFNRPRLFGLGGRRRGGIFGAGGMGGWGGGGGWSGGGGGGFSGGGASGKW